MSNDRTATAWPHLLIGMESGHRERPVAPELLDWTRLLAAGDDAAWRRFHERYYLPLLRYAAHCARDPSAASEIVQQAYLRIARHAKPFAEEPAFWGWLCCVVRCAAVDHARHRTRRNLLLERFAHWHAAHFGEDAGAGVSAEDVASLTAEALARLPAADATLLRRKYCEGCTVAELAADLNTTAKAIENRLARLRERLREIVLRIR